VLSCITHLGYLAVVKLICARKYLPLGKLAPVSARKGLCGDDKGSLLGKGGSAGANQGIFCSSWTVFAITVQCQRRLVWQLETDNAQVAIA
jgi:hypothetical protein